MFWKSKPKGTLVTEKGFHLILPGLWTPEPSTDPTRWSYHEESRREQLTVSIMGDTHAMTHDELSSTFGRLVEMRRDVEINMPGVTGVSVTEPMFGELENGTLVARYEGSQPAAQRRFHCLILGSKRLS